MDLNRKIARARVSTDKGYKFANFSNFPGKHPSLKSA